MHFTDWKLTILSVKTVFMLFAVVLFETFLSPPLAYTLAYIVKLLNRIHVTSLTLTAGFVIILPLIST